MLEKIAKKDGIGEILAQGSNGVGKKFKIPKDSIATINNMEVPYHDMRFCHGMALTYAYSPRGPCHTTADGFKVFRKDNEVDFSSLRIKKIKMNSSSKTMVKNIIKKTRITTCTINHPQLIIIAPGTPHSHTENARFLLGASNHTAPI